MQGQVMAPPLSLRRLLRVALAWFVAASPGVTAAMAGDPGEAASGDLLRKFAGHVQCAAERERTALARELHDEFGSVFTALSLNCTQVLRILPPEDTAARERLLEMNGLIEQGLGSMARLIADLRPQVLDDLGLGPAIESEVRAFGRRTGIARTVRVPEEEVALAPERATALFRVVQESLTNVARYAGASCVQVVLRRIDANLSLEVRDDGRGITPDKIADPNSYGILGMRERMQLLGGDFEIEGSPGRGTRVHVTLPLG